MKRNYVQDLTLDGDDARTETPGGYSPPSSAKRIKPAEAMDRRLLDQAATLLEDYIEGDEVTGPQLYLFLNIGKADVKDMEKVVGLLSDYSQLKGDTHDLARLVVAAAEPLRLCQFLEKDERNDKGEIAVIGEQSLAFFDPGNTLSAFFTTAWVLLEDLTTIQSRMAETEEVTQQVEAASKQYSTMHLEQLHEWQTAWERAEARMRVAVEGKRRVEASVAAAAVHAAAAGGISGASPNGELQAISGVDGQPVTAPVAAVLDLALSTTATTNKLIASYRAARAALDKEKYEMAAVSAALALLDATRALHRRAVEGGAEAIKTKLEALRSRATALVGQAEGEGAGSGGGSSSIGGPLSLLSLPRRFCAALETFILFHAERLMETNKRHEALQGELAKLNRLYAGDEAVEERRLAARRMEGMEEVKARSGSALARAAQESEEFWLELLEGRERVVPRELGLRQCLGEGLVEVQRRLEAQLAGSAPESSPELSPFLHFFDAFMPSRAAQLGVLPPSPGPKPRCVIM